ncbi:MAG: hypothetical protein WDW38_004732 [Sanguina aurantia]
MHGGRPSQRHQRRQQQQQQDSLGRKPASRQQLQQQQQQQQQQQVQAVRPPGVPGAVSPPSRVAPSQVAWRSPATGRASHAPAERPQPRPTAAARVGVGWVALKIGTPHCKPPCAPLPGVLPVCGTVRSTHSPGQACAEASSTDPPAAPTQASTHTHTHTHALTAPHVHPSPAGVERGGVFAPMRTAACNTWCHPGCGRLAVDLPSAHRSRRAGIDRLPLDARAGRSQELGAQVDLLRRQLAEERVGREVGALEEARLKGWIQEMRSERRRLEDRLMGPHAAAVGHVQEMREGLDEQVLSLSRQRDSLQAEAAELQHTAAAAASLGQENGVLRQALALERQRGARYRDVRGRMEAHLEDIVQQLEALRVQHQQTVVAIQAESDQLSSKLRKGGRRSAVLESELERVRAHLLLVQSQVHDRDSAIAGLRSSLEDAQSGSQQQLLQLEVSLVQLQDRLTESLLWRGSLSAGPGLLADQALLPHRRACVQLSLHASQAEAESGKQANVVLLASLTESHQETADALTEVQLLEGKCADAERTAAAALVSTQRQHEADIESIHQQHDSQLAAADKQFSLLQIQADCSGDSHDKVVAVQGALRRERDELWAEAENLKADIETLVREKDEVAGRLNALRNEVKSTIDQVMQDSAHPMLPPGLLELSEHLRRDASDAAGKSEKAKGTVTHLKDQVRDMLVQRDDLHRELQTEKQYSEELNRILVPTTHVHLAINQQFFAHGGDSTSPACHVTIRASEGQIRPEKRRTVVTMLVPLLQQAIDNLDGERVIAYFEELPVENIAVGANIAVFGKPRFVSSTGEAAVAEAK